MANSPKDIKADMLAIMRATGIRPELIHAYEKTGLLLDEAGYQRLSAKEKAEYDAAIDEYLAAGSSPD